MGHLRNHSILLFALAFLASSPARADYHYASHQGSNEYPYTSWETAADSIKFAVDAADPGDTVYIGAGEWQERVFMTQADTNLAIIGAGMDSTYWWWDVLGELTLITRKNSSVEHIHFAHTRTGCIDASVGDNTIITGCLFTGGHGAILGGGQSKLKVENCILDSTDVWVLSTRRMEVRNCLVDYTNDPAFLISSGDTAIFENNIIINSESRSISLPVDMDSSLVRNNLIYNINRPNHWFLGSCENCPVAINNTYDNFRRIFDSDAALRYRSPYEDMLENNSLSRMKAGLYIFQYTGWTVTASYFNLWDVDNFGLSDGPPVVWDTVGIQWAYPMYAGEGDYHLQAYSPLIDAGDPGILDVDGTRSDMGGYGGPGGSSYEYLDLPPLVPDSLSAIVIEDTIFINWRYNHEADFDRYQLHRETYSGFEPSILNLIGEPDTSYYVDTDLTPGHNYYYRIAAVDNQDNLSDYSVELEVITTGVEGGWGAEMPTITTIESNYPNPFNSQTTIVYTVANLGPLPARINIDIYDIMGRKVRNLVNERRGAGVHRITWDGRNDSGSDCPSGVYFARISQWGVDYLDRHQKLVLLR
jgi:hypothetical protein